MARLVNETKVITNPVRLSYANIWDPKSINGSDPKYSVCILIPKEDTETLECLKTAIDNAKADGKDSKWGGKIPGKLKLPLRDGDDPDEDQSDDENYNGCYFINTNSNTAPGIIDLAKNKIDDESEVYSGCWCRVSVNMFPYDAKGNKGVGCGLNNLQKVRDDEALAGRAKAEDDFDDDYEGDDSGLVDDMMN